MTNWRADLAPPPTTFVPRQDNSYDCGVFVCLYAAYIAIQHPFTFTQADIDNVRMWMVHLMDEEGKTYDGGLGS
jgi:sentrin-specific protease 1